jgi:hypothetical protein
MYGYGYSLYNTQFFTVLGDIVASMIGAFKTRVAADGGSFEAEACLQTILEKFNSIP